MSTYLHKKTKEKLCMGIRGKFPEHLDPCEEKFMDYHYREFLDYRCWFENEFLPILQRKSSIGSFTSLENEQIIFWYLNKIPVYKIQDSIPHLYDWLKRSGLKFKSICLLKSFVQNTIDKQREIEIQLRCGNFGFEHTRGGKDPWMFHAWWECQGKNFHPFEGPREY
jgi:hypothetical protein